MARLVRPCLLFGLCSATLFAQRVNRPVSAEMEAAASEISQVNRILSAGNGVGPGLLSRRAALLSQMIASDPARAIELALRPDVASRVRGGAPGGTIEEYGEWTGSVSTTISDDFISNRAHTRRYLRRGRDSAELFFVGEVPEAIATVRVRGLRLNDRIAVETSTRENAGVFPAQTDIVNDSVQAACTTLGAQNIAVLMVTMPSNRTFPPRYTNASLQQTHFGKATDTDPRVSLNGFWNDVSYGQTSATGQVFGPFDLTADYDYSTANALADAAVKLADSTVDFTKFTRIALVFPIASWGGFGGTNSLGCQTVISPARGTLCSSVGWFPAFPNGAPSVKLVAHELGHGLGLNHSSSDDYGTVALGAPGTAGTLAEYGDPFSTMGGSGHYPAPHKNFLRWLSAGAGITELTASGNVSLFPMGSEAGSRGLRVLRDGNSGAWLWLEYRQGTGVDKPTQASGSNVFDGALVHYEDPALNSLYTYLLHFNPVAIPNNFRSAALTSGSTWSDPYSPVTLAVGTPTVNGLPITVTYDPSCASLQFLSTSFPVSGGSGSVTVTAPGTCSWTATTDAAWIVFSGQASGTGNGTVNFTMAANAGTNQRNGYIHIKRQSTRIIEAGSVLTVLGVSPSFGSGDSSQFTFRFNDSNGYQDLSFADVFFGAGNACHLQIHLQSKTVFLLLDSGSFSAGLNLSAAGGTVSNSRCTLSSSGSSVSGSGTEMLLTLPMSFSTSFGGGQGMRASASGSSGATPTLPVGTWIVPNTSQPLTTITANEAGAPFSVDFVSAHQAPASFNWAPNSTHIITWRATNPKVSGARYVFQNWVDGGGNPRAITASAESATYVADIKAQYQVDAIAVPTIGGGVSVSPASSDGYYDSGTSITVTGIPNDGYSFWYYDGNFSNTAQKTLAITGPLALTANYYCSLRYQAYLSGKQSAGASSGLISWTLGSGCAWSVSSDAAWLTFNGNLSGSGSGAVSYSIAQNTGASRTAKITLTNSNSLTVTQSPAGDLAPSFVSMTPSSATGLSQKFSVQLSDPNGTQQIDYLYLNLDHPDSATKCDLSFSKFSGTWYGYVNGAPTSVALPGNDLSNAVCRLKGSDFSFTANGTLATLTFGVAFQPGYAGTVNIAGSFRDAGSSLYSPYSVIGQYTVSPQTQTIAVSPIAGSIPVNTAPFTLTVSASSGLAVTMASTTASVCTASGFTVTIVAAGGCSLTFSQPGNSAYASAPTVTKSFTTAFADVQSGDYYLNAVNLMAQRSITAGCGSNGYCPTLIVTRYQMAIFMVRAIMGSDNFTYSTTPHFGDVPANAAGFKWIQKMFDLGITAGCGGGNYCPEASVTREQMAAFIVRARYGAGASFTYPSTQTFSDVNAFNPLYKWVQRLAQDGITAGCGGGKYCPLLPVIRGDMAIFIMRGAFNRLLPASTPVVSSITPATLGLGKTAVFTVAGTNTSFVQGVTTLAPIPGVTVGAITVNGPTSLSVVLTAASDAPVRPKSIVAITSEEQAVLPNGLVVQ